MDINQKNVQIVLNLQDLRTLFGEWQNEIELAKRKREAEEELLPEEDVIVEFSVSKPTLWRWKKAGYLKPSKLGRTNYYRRADINAAMGRREA